MIYLDNAATSFPKPAETTAAVCAAMRNCAGYGRSGHAAAMRSAEIVYECRRELAELFGAPSVKHIAFALNATMALNEAIHALVPDGSRVCISGYEHNAVVRPLVEKNCKLDIVQPDLDRDLLDCWERKIRSCPVCVIVNHASNVFGYLQPIEEIGALCARYGVPLIVDASQTAGICDIDLKRISNCAAVCMAGHKGLLGPQGTGIMVFTDLLPRRALICGGTGSMSMVMHQPKEIPDMFESGTLNIPGIAGLLESVKIVRKSDMAWMSKHEYALKERLQGKIAEIPGLRVIDRAWPCGKMAVLSVVSDRIPCDMLGEALAERGVFVRTGLHCAPLAHRTEGTIRTGTIRFSVGTNNTVQEIDMAAEVLRTIMNTF